MKTDVPTTAEQILAGLRSGNANTIPVNADDFPCASASQILNAFRARFARANAAGIARRLSNCVLEPANPFAPRARRAVRQEALVLGGLALAVLTVTVYFNLQAMAR
jgi:hypothetical protein